MLSTRKLLLHLRILSSKDKLSSILFQREVYPSDDFHMVKKYGQTVLVTQDMALENYLDKSVNSRCGLSQPTLTLL